MSWERLQMLMAAKRRTTARQTLAFAQAFNAANGDADAWNEFQSRLIEEANGSE